MPSIGLCCLLVRRFIIKKIVSNHNHRPYLKEEIMITPQNILITEEEKAESLKLYYQREKMSVICEGTVSKFHPNEKDFASLRAMKIKLQNYIYNNLRKGDEFSFQDFINELNKAHEDLIALFITFGVSLSFSDIQNLKAI